MELKSYLTNSKLPLILLNDISEENLHHEYCLQILMNLSPNESWFAYIKPIEFADKLISRFRLVLEGIYNQHDSFPSQIALFNQSFDHYISPYFWIFNSLATFSTSLLDHIKESLLPDKMYMIKTNL